MAKGDYQGSADAVARSLELHRDVNAQLLLAEALLNLKEKEKAQAVFQQMLQDYGNRAIWHFVFGGAYQDANYPGGRDSRVQEGPRTRPEPPARALLSGFGVPGNQQHGPHA